MGKCQNRAPDVPCTLPIKYTISQNYNNPPNTCEFRFSWNPTNQDLQGSAFVYLFLRGREELWGAFTLKMEKMNRQISF